MYIYYYLCFYKKDKNLTKIEIVAQIILYIDNTIRSATRDDINDEPNSVDREMYILSSGYNLPLHKDKKEGVAYREKVNDAKPTDMKRNIVGMSNLGF